MVDGFAFWHWWIIAIALVSLEIFIPHAFFQYLAVSAGFVGLIQFAFPEQVSAYQWPLFGTLSLISVIAWALHIRKNPQSFSHPSSMRRAEQYIGRTYLLEHPLENGQGSIELDGKEWNLNGEECETGSLIRIIDVRDSTLIAICQSRPKKMGRSNHRDS